MTESITKEKTSRTVWVLRIAATAAVIAWMCVIFAMSADDADASSRKSDEIVDFAINVAVKTGLTTREKVTESVRDRLCFIVRKGGHLTEYAILGTLLVLMLAAWGMRRLILRGAAALPGAAGDAATDEYHQLSVSGRSGQWSDVAIDTCGALAGILLTLLVMRTVRRRRENRRKLSENVTKQTTE